MKHLSSPHDLSEDVRDRIACYRLDVLLEKHERYGWRWLLDRARFVEVDSTRILLPFLGDGDEQITVLRTLRDPRDDLLTVFLRFAPQRAAETMTAPNDEEDRLAVCVRVPEHDFFITIVYHELFSLDGLPPVY